MFDGEIHIFSGLFHLGPGFYDPNFGEVLVNGVPLRHLPVRTWRRMLGYVGQHPVLFATSALENIKVGDGLKDSENGGRASHPPKK